MKLSDQGAGCWGWHGPGETRGPFRLPSLAASCQAQARSSMPGDCVARPFCPAQRGQGHSGGSHGCLRALGHQPTCLQDPLLFLTLLISHHWPAIPSARLLGEAGGEGAGQAGLGPC